jgi:C1A family cysteine protease
VALVGYTDSGFIVRNSWGTSAWGDRGFGYASNAYAKEAFDEAYGVTL